ncbi:hypothetical protein EV44_g0253 [Erysiphe necator]|uniref:Uncharacterized protein n=1 Tax=Uncinula necator TaxID=52586 RepID=A0A0B1NUI6_UNCNE|nr:hypothetical protein EV44_g0253 [Erysiphe necator]
MLFWQCCVASSVRAAKLFCDIKVVPRVLFPGICDVVGVWVAEACDAKAMAQLFEVWVFKVSQCAALRRSLAADAALRIWEIWAFDGNVLSFLGRMRHSRESEA